MPTDTLTVGEKAVRLIRGGKCDDELDQIREALVTRMKYLQSKQALENLLALDVGDVVRINSNVKPRYLAGQRCTVIEVSNRRRSGIPMILVALPATGQWGKFASGKVLFSPASLTLLEKADA